MTHGKFVIRQFFHKDKCSLTWSFSSSINTYQIRLQILVRDNGPLSPVYSYYGSVLSCLRALSCIYHPNVKILCTIVSTVRTGWSCPWWATMLLSFLTMSLLACFTTKYVKNYGSIKIVTYKRHCVVISTSTGDSYGNDRSSNWRRSN